MIEEDDDAWARADELLDAALAQLPAHRREWLAEACAGDGALAARVESLLGLAEGADPELVPGGGMHGRLWDELAQELDAEDAPELTPGGSLGSYQIRELLGTGGMGRVFRAHDLGLGRDVAIKALSGEFANDAPSLRRFEREARLLATLNHPNIAAIYGFHVFEGRPYLVLELVEGETLAERLSRGPLPASEAVPVALQIATALEEAHRNGIVHRDLKPSNVKLSPDGRVKVLDFGLARQVASAQDAVVGDPGALTRSGVILGTIPYMSPEQARGEDVDERTDVWAFGCLLFEMLSGRRAFEGRTLSDLLAAVLRDEVDFSPLPPATPGSLRRLLRRCLRKDRRLRVQHMGDVRLEIEDREPDDVPAQAWPPASSPLRPRNVFLLAAGVLAVLAAAWSVTSPARGPVPGPRRFVLDLPPGVTLSTDYAVPFALSPDGQTVVALGYEGKQGRLYRRDLARLEWTALPGTEGAWQPFFSPDGLEVAFFAERKLKRVRLDGSSPVTLAQVGNNPRGGSWAPDGTIVFGAPQTSPLLRVSARGGEPTPLTSLDPRAEETTHRWPQVLPGGKAVLFTAGFEEADFDDAALAVVSLDTGTRQTLLRGAAHGRYVASGHLVYGRAGQLLAVPFDLARLAVTGPPEVVVDGVRYDARNGGTGVAVADDGTLGYVTGAASSIERRLVWVDEQGRRERVTEAARRYLDLRLSPDGRRVALRIGGPATSDLWTLDLAGGTLSQVSYGITPFRPAWTPDGTRLTVGAVEKGAVEKGKWRLLNVPADGRGTVATLHEGTRRMYPAAWSPDGRFLVYQERGPGANWDIKALEFDASGRSLGVEALAASPASETNATLSPDGTLLAYESDEMDGLVEVYVQPFHGSGAKVKASSDAGRWPLWAGRNELFYWKTFVRQMRRVALRQQDGRLVVGSDELLWGADQPDGQPPLYNFAGLSFDVHGPRRRFLMMEPASSGPTEPGRAILALGWAENPGRARPARP